jgi:putative peptide zinc metalloprotease protein
VSYIYRWVVTFVILKFMATFLKPYKLEVVSELLAVGALASMIGWPMYRLIKNTRKRGRLPDMKPVRVSISATVVAVVLLVVFLVPLPVTRIRQAGVVQVQPNDIAQVAVDVPGILKEVLVKEGQYVPKGKELARFESMELESQRDLAQAQVEIKDKLIKSLNDSIGKELDPERQNGMREQRTKAEGEHRQALINVKRIKLEMDKLTLVAPRAGIVIGLPPVDEVGKRWDREQQTTVFCSIGDKTKLRVIVPLSPADYDLLVENYDKRKLTPNDPLEATIRVQGHDSRLWKGRISQLPKSDAKDVPIYLTNKAGGPLAVKPGSEANRIIPQSQVFLVGIDFEQPDDSIAINSHAQVKIHCEYRSCAWWIYRTISSTFDIPLMKL